MINLSCFPQNIDASEAADGGPPQHWVSASIMLIN